MNRPLLLARADGHATIGAGHVHRAIALSQAWQEAGGEAALVAARLDPTLAARAERAGVAVRVLAEDGPAALAAEAADASWVALDGYDLGPDHHRAAGEGGALVLVVDDHGAVGRYDVDLVLDQNLGATADPYADRAVRTVTLLGERYVLLRAGFAGGDEVERAPRVLLTLGGFDDGRVDDLRQAIGARAEVAVAGGDVEDMATLMRSCAMAVSAAGSTAWELAATRTPMALVTVADNQVPVARNLAAAGAALHLGDLATLDVVDAADRIVALLADPDQRAALAEVASHRVDGRGAARVAQAMRSCELDLRDATPDDCRLLWEWANDPAVRSASLSSEPIPWEVHVEWFDRRLRSPDAWTYVAELEGRPAGQVRFDRRGDVVEISVLVEPGHRGRNLSPFLIAQGSARVAAVANVERVEAVVRVGNEASARAFASAGFTPLGQEHGDGPDVLRFERRLRP